MDDFDRYAHFYELDYGDRDDDLLMLEQFAARCGSPILELGCGTGRALLPLARAGYRLTGLDISPAMLDLARRKLAAEDLAEGVTLLQADMRDLDLEARFNLAFVAVNSFMHLPTTADQLAALARIREHLNPGGLLLLDLFHPDPSRLLDAGGQLTLERVIPDPTIGSQILKLFSRRIDLGQQTLYLTYIFDEVDAQGRVRRHLFPFALRYLFRYELELLLRHAGFQVEALYGSYNLDDFDSDSEKLIAVARRPD